MSLLYSLIQCMYMYLAMAGLPSLSTIVLCTLCIYNVHVHVHVHVHIHGYMYSIVVLCYLICSTHTQRLNLSSPVIQSPSVCELVRQHLSSGSVCDPETSKWHSISDITYVITSDCSSHVKLQPSFMKHFAVVQWDQYRSVLAANSTLIPRLIYMYMYSIA